MTPSKSETPSLYGMVHEIRKPKPPPSIPPQPIIHPPHTYPQPYTLYILVTQSLTSPIPQPVFSQPIPNPVPPSQSATTQPVTTQTVPSTVSAPADKEIPATYAEQLSSQTVQTHPESEPSTETESTVQSVDSEAEIADITNLLMSTSTDSNEYHMKETEEVPSSSTTQQQPADSPKNYQWSLVHI